MSDVIFNLPATGSAVTSHAAAITFMFATKLSTASAAPAEIIRAHLCRSIVAARRVHRMLTLCSLSILICIPGCFKLNYFSFYCHQNFHKIYLWRLTMISEKMLTEVVVEWDKWKIFLRHQLWDMRRFWVRLQQNNFDFITRPWNVKIFKQKRS